MIEDDEPRGRPKWKRFSQLLNDPQAGRVLRGVEVHDPPPTVADDEEAVEHTEGDRWNLKKSIAAIASRWFRKNASQRLAGSGSLGARFIQRETVLSERSKPSINSSPWIRGAPQVGFSSTILKINSRTSFETCFLPNTRRVLEMVRQYKANPAVCQRTTVSGFTIMRACFQPDQNLLTKTQKSLSNATSRGLGCLRFKTVSCCRRTRFSSRRFRRERKTRSMAPVRTAIMANMNGSYRIQPANGNGLSC